MDFLLLSFFFYLYYNSILTMLIPLPVYSWRSYTYNVTMFSHSVLSSSPIPKHKTIQKNILLQLLWFIFRGHKDRLFSFTVPGRKLLLSRLTFSSFSCEVDVPDLSVVTLPSLHL